MTIFERDQCLLCHKKMEPKIGWRQLFSKEKKRYLCQDCEDQLDLITGETCRLCHRPFAYLEGQYRKADLCLDCVRWEQDEQWNGCLKQNISLFSYNDFLKETIARFKFRGDYVIAKAFSPLFREKIKLLPYDLLVPIPLSEERLLERGFNQAKALVREAGYSSCEFLERTHSEKQSKKSRLERIEFAQVFRVKESSGGIAGKNILLIDDIYTTGSTLYHAAKALKEAGAESVMSLTLARG
ncbi:ComF family protein [Cytobacillus sp. Hz8]|uniref:ComF family protein n=1 Tax=Cytobacillus sp. Hz8 TaxID=3347168 RepID=UPI0035DE7764